MTENTPTLEAWRALYDLMERVKEMAPWEWMFEDQIFGVQVPETEALGFVSVMGMLGEHFSVAAYNGLEGLYGFWKMQAAGERNMTPEHILETPQLQASFEDREMVEKEDRAIMKELGLRFRGRNAWPLFRSYRPGYFPWFLEADEARLLTVALEQTLVMAPRIKEDSNLLPAQQGRYLVRVQGDSGVWEDQTMDVPPPPPRKIDIEIDGGILDALERLPRSRNVVEVDFFMAPMVIEEGPRPYYPYMLMMVDSGSGMILCSEILSPEPTLDAMWGKVPELAFKHLLKARIAPRQIKVRSKLLHSVLSFWAKELNFPIKESRSLRSLDEAKAAMFAFMGGQGMPW